KRAGNDGELDDLASFDPEAGEQITETQTRQYKIVGIYQRLPHNIEKYSCPGYTALTVGEADSDSYDLFVISKHPSKFTKKFAFGELNERLVANNDVLRLCGDINSGSLRSVFYGFAGVLVFLIALGSISLIFNSFSISVSERTKQFGILKSVGATRKQIRGAVLYEALLLSAIAIPIGLIVGILGIGITLWCLRDSFSAISGGNGVKMYLVLNIPALLTAVAVCLVTTLISAWLPAKKAVKINPIEAIRQSGDVKVRGKDVKTSKLTSKLFGFEGTLAVKNFKRNRKRYRSTVISLALSITLFIAASSFCSYFKNTLTGVSKDNVDCDIFFSLSDEDRSKCQQVVEILGKTEGVESFSYYSQNVETVNLKPENISNEYKSLPKDAKQEYTDGSFGMMAVINFFDDETFNAICAQNGINPEKYYDKADPRALMQNDYGDYYYDRKDKRRWFSCSPIKESTLPFTAEVSVLKDIEGYILYEEEYTDDGEDIIAFYYYPEEYIENFPFDGEH
ncbi:MAG: ABC transporter permease, partial [Clostridia bacterium]|nr:ABC transporter permease [Clostridia bacterium]